VALLHSFEFARSIRELNGVLAADSTCAMAYWGIALSRWTNPFLANTRDTAQLRAGKSAIDHATRLAVGATPRERQYVAAAAELYASYETVPQGQRIVNY